MLPIFPTEQKKEKMLQTYRSPQGRRSREELQWIHLKRHTEKTTAQIDKRGLIRQKENFLKGRVVNKREQVEERSSGRRSFLHERKRRREVE